jgi:hypothetical protein
VVVISCKRGVFTRFGGFLVNLCRLLEIFQCKCSNGGLIDFALVLNFFGSQK